MSSRKNILSGCLCVLISLLLLAVVVKSDTCADSFDCGANSFCSGADALNGILGTCTCNDGYGLDTGFCVPMCYNRLESDLNVCSGAGTCDGPNMCTCEPGYGGNQCEYHTCDGIRFNDTSACGGFGTCDGPDTCDCPLGYEGEFCEHYSCHGISTNSTQTICSGHGKCIALDTCQCFPGYEGVNCEIPINPCQLSASIEGKKEITIARSNPLSLFGVANIAPECGFTSYTAEWTHNITARIGSSEDLLVIKPFTFPISETTYQFTYTIRNGNYSDSATVIVHVKLAPLHVRIAGGNRVAFPVGKTIDIEADVEDPEEQEGDVFSWRCSVFNSVASCPDGINRVVYATHTDELVIPASVNTHTGKYIFTITYSKSSGSRPPKSASVTMELIAPGAPFVHFDDDIQPIIARRLQSFAVSITNRVESYRWLIDGTVVSGPNYIATRSRLLVRPEALVPGSTYTIRYEATNSIGTGYAEIDVTVNLPPYGGSITITPTNGTALETTFEFLAENWADDQLYPLRYEWSIRYTDGRRLSKSYMSYNPKFIVPFLPRGSFEVSVIVFDEFGDSATRTESLTISPRTFANRDAKYNALTQLLTNFISEDGEHRLSERRIGRLFMITDVCLASLEDTSDEGSSRRVTATPAGIVSSLLSLINETFVDVKNYNLTQAGIVSSFDNSYFENMGNNLRGVVESGALAAGGKTTVLNLLDSMMDSVGDVQNNVNIDGPLLDVFSDLLDDLSGQYAEKVDMISDKLLKYYAQNQVTGTTTTKSLSNMVYVSMKLDVPDFANKNLNLPATNVSFSSAPSIVFPATMSDKLTVAGLSVAVARVKLFGIAANPYTYAPTSNSLSVASSISVELTDSNGTVSSISSLTDPITISLPAQYTEKRGWKAHCRYYDTTSAQWVKDNTLSVASATSNRIVCETSHLTAFSATYDKNPSSTNIGRILGLALGIPIPIAFISLCLLVIGIIVGVVIKKKKAQHGDDSIEMREANV